MRVNNIEVVEKWVMGFGTRATVARPRMLVERVAEGGEGNSTEVRNH
jgi:hypothetical protein